MVWSSMAQFAGFDKKTAIDFAIHLETEEKYVKNTEWRGHEAGAPKPNIPQPEIFPIPILNSGVHVWLGLSLPEETTP